jgi:cytochrome oxidase Cu insertion factor (SCO1/SenC/PrrC family)
VTATTRWALIAAVPLAALAVVAAILLTRSSSPAAPKVSVDDAGVIWAAGEVAAPPIALQHADGSAFSLSSLRGRRVIVTFVDPRCTTFCPRASHVIDDALRTLPTAERPAVVAVSVDPTVRDEATLNREAKRFRWLPQWRWAVGAKAALEKTWRAYHIAVVPTEDEISHTEAAYVVDADGYERSLLLWPFTKRDVASALASAS